MNPNLSLADVVDSKLTAHPCPAKGAEEGKAKPFTPARKATFVNNKKNLIPLSFLVLALSLAILNSCLQTPSQPPNELVWTTESEQVVNTDPDGPGPLLAGVPRLEGSLVIDMIDGISPAQLREFRQDYGIDARYNSIHSLDSGLVVARVDEARMSTLLDTLAGDERVEVVEPNYLVTLLDDEDDDDEDDDSTSSFPNDPEYKYQWHMDQIHCEEAWAWTTGEGVVVAVIDTGVAYADSEDGRFHQVEDLKGTEFVEGYDFINHQVEAYDDNAHGTHVAGTVAQATNNGVGVTGVAFGSTIMPVKVLSGRGSGSTAGVADGIRFAADNGAKIMNLSLGSSQNSPIMEKAVTHAVNKGVLVVCAAGNSNRPKSGFPAGCEGAISVSSTNYEEHLAFYSNYGPDITIAAPGGDTRSDKNGDGKPDGVYQNTIGRMDPSTSGYYMFQGTSMASPHAAAVFSLGASMGVTKSEALEELVYRTARPAPEDAKEGYGAGIIDAGAIAHEAGFVYGQQKLMYGGLAALLALAFYLRRARIFSILLTLPGLLIGSVGLLWWMPALGLNSEPLCPYLVNGFPTWDLFCLGVAQHGSLLTHSLLIPALVCCASLMIRILRPLAAGFAAGVAGHLVFVALNNTVEMSWLPEDLQVYWLAANAFVCVALATATASRD